jgi:large subunit ribosomal protein L31
MGYPSGFGDPAKVMKTETHPSNHPVLFVDGSHEWTGVSTLKSNDKRVIDGVEHYVVNVEISAFTHPFYTGQKKIVDSAGRVEKFLRRYGNADKK